MIRSLVPDSSNSATKPPPLRLAATLGWSDAALIVELQDATILFGHWDQMFGCWSVASGTIAKLHIEACLFDRLGLWRKDATPFGLNILAGASLWHRYLALIPSPVRRLVAPYGREQWGTLERIAEEPHLIYQMDREQAGLSSVRCQLSAPRRPVRP